jgi:hypothetical protein
MRASGSERAMRCATIEGLWLIGKDVGAASQLSKDTAEFSTIRGFLYVDSRNADAPGHDYQAQQ